MKITVINGTEKHGVTYRLKEIFLSEFKGKADITEYYLPKDCPDFCIGCTNCFFKGEHTKVKFLFCRLIQKSLHKAAPEYLDGKYWAEQGWLGSVRPWK